MLQQIEHKMLKLFSVLGEAVLYEVLVPYKPLFVCFLAASENGALFTVTIVGKVDHFPNNISKNLYFFRRLKKKKKKN